MGLLFSKNAPQEGFQTIQSHFSHAKEFSTKEGMRILVDEPSLNLSEGIQIWSLGLQQVNAENPLIEALPGEWRYIIFRESEPISEAQLKTNEISTEVTSVIYNRMTNNMVEALGVAENLPEVQEQDFEPRLLLIESLVFAALWLHSEVNNEDIIIPTNSGRLSLPEFSPTSIEGFREELEIQAIQIRTQIEQNPGPSGGSGTKPTGVKTNKSFVLPSTLKLNTLNLAESPPIGGGASKNLPLTMQYQEQNNWCWSAVGTSVGLFFKTGKWTQCDTANGCLTGNEQKDCCNKPVPCDVYGYLNLSLGYTKSFDVYNSGTITLDEIKKEIDSNQPVCTRVAWHVGGAHFTAITGYSGDEITIQDSIFGTSTIKYNDYPGSYSSGGDWTHTYFCKPNFA